MSLLSVVVLLVSLPLIIWAKAGKKVALFDRKLAPGGGMWGGAMMFNDIVVQEEAMPIVR